METTSCRAVLTGKVEMIADVLDDPHYKVSEQATRAGFRSTLAVPLMRGDQPIGCITVGRPAPGRFGDDEIGLLQTFADQAVIAIKNVRLFNETKEALERQTATADILKVIASSRSDLRPVFEAIVHSSTQLLGGHGCGLYKIADEMLHLEAFTPVSPEADETLRNSFPIHVSEYPQLALIEKGESFQFADTEDAPEIQVKVARLRGFRSIIVMPLRSRGATIGMIACTRREPGVFADHDFQLLRGGHDRQSLTRVVSAATSAAMELSGACFSTAPI